MIRLHPFATLSDVFPSAFPSSGPLLQLRLVLHATIRTRILSNRSIARQIRTLARGGRLDNVLLVRTRADEAPRKTSQILQKEFQDFQTLCQKELDTSIGLVLHFSSPFLPWQIDLGFCCDVRPIFCGFSSTCWWFNVKIFSHHCHLKHPRIPSDVQQITQMSHQEVAGAPLKMPMQNPPLERVQRPTGPRRPPVQLVRPLDLARDSEGVSECHET